MSVATELTAGGLAGAAGILATQPMDTVRVRLQSSGAGLGRGASYAGIAECFRDALSGEGVRGLYKGVASPALTVGAMNAVLFFSYEAASAALRSGQPVSAQSVQQERRLELHEVAVAGAVGGLASSFITGPTELVKCIAQVDLRSQGLLREEWAIWRRLCQDRGVLHAHGPLRGLSATVLRDTPSFGLYFWIYEAGVRRFGRSDLTSFAFGGLAGACAWTCIYPLDVLKTRWQTAAPGQYTSLRHCARDIARREGRGALVRGYGATMARAFPQNGVIFCTYEFVKRRLPP